MVPYRLPLVLALAIVLGVPFAAEACDAGKVVLSTENWNGPVSGDLRKTGANEFEATAPIGHFAQHSLLDLPGKTVTVCAELSVVSAPRPDAFAAALMFWSSDGSYYFLEINAAGQYSMDHIVDNKWHELIPSTDSAALNKGLGAWNELQVSPQGDGTLAITINGKPVDSVIARRLANASLYGFAAISVPGGATTARVRNLRLIEPS